MGLQLGANPGNTTKPVAPPTAAPGTVDPTTQTLMAANFDPTKGPVSKFDSAGNLIGPDGTTVLTTAQIHAGTVPDSLLNQIANNPLVVGGVTLATAPLVGGATALGDTLNGKYGQIPGDLAYANTGGIVGNNGGSATGIINPNTISAAGTAIGKDVNAAGSAIGTGVKDAASAVGNAIGGGPGPDTSSSDAETARTNALADSLTTQANAAGDQASTDRGRGTQIYQQQQDSIAGLTAAANGTVPSAAEIQGKTQASIDAARQYGLAAALQGNNPGAALRQASLGGAAIAGTDNANATALRATEQANARNTLASTLGNVQSNNTANVYTDTGQQGNLNNAGVTSQGQGVTSTGQKITAQSQKYTADQVAKGAAIGAAGTLVGGLLSDKRAKKNIAKVGLADELGKGVHGVTFEYRPEAGEDDMPHFGLLADELEKVIPGVVKRGPSGYKQVDAGHMTMANTAILSELAKRIMELEKEARR